MASLVRLAPREEVRAAVAVVRAAVAAVTAAEVAARAMVAEARAQTWHVGAGGLSRTRHGVA